MKVSNNDGVRDVEAQSSREDREEGNPVLGVIFGIKPNAMLRRGGERSEKVKELYETATNYAMKHPKPKGIIPFTKSVLIHLESFVNLKNVIWAIFFGWWMALVYFIVGAILFITVFGIPHAKLCWRLAPYFFWPFGKFLMRERVRDHHSEQH